MEEDIEARRVRSFEECAAATHIYHYKVTWSDGEEMLLSKLGLPGVTEEFVIPDRWKERAEEIGPNCRYPERVEFLFKERKLLPYALVFEGIPY